MTSHYYDNIASGYDELHGAEQEAKLRAFVTRMMTAGRALKAGDHVLDVGCATGRSEAVLRELVPAIASTLVWKGVEPSAGLIAHASEDVQSRIVHCAGESLPFADRQFALVLSLTCLQNYDDANAGIREMARVVQADGVVCVSFIKKSPKAAQLGRVIRDGLHVLDAWEFEQDMMFLCTMD